MDDPKALALFKEVFKRSAARQVLWEPTSAPDTFVAPMLGKYRLTLYPFTSENSWGDPIGAPKLVMSDKQDNLLVEITTNITGINAEDLNGLLVLARRVALKADEKIDELLNELRKGE